MRARDWFRQQLERYQDDPVFILEQLLMRLNEQIVRAMETEGLSRAQVAERLGVSRASITQLLNGRPNLTLKRLVEIATALGTRVEVKLLPMAMAERPSRRRGRSLLVVSAEQDDQTERGLPQKRTADVSRKTAPASRTKGRSS